MNTLVSWTGQNMSKVLLKWREQKSPGRTRCLVSKSLLLICRLRSACHETRTRQSPRSVPAPCRSPRATDAQDSVAGIRDFEHDARILTDGQCALPDSDDVLRIGRSPQGYHQNRDTSERPQCVPLRRFVQAHSPVTYRRHLSLGKSSGLQPGQGLHGEKSSRCLHWISTSISTPTNHRLMENANRPEGAAAQTKIDSSRFKPRTPHCPFLHLDKLEERAIYI
jgi:hypothetical protein